ncbi:hypothetical protein PL11201_530182 [Planktothrix sp. PCC 11201]|uniref:hypothetical protein n=1 Tax=Planktothrix sp. PCC 11201 TaxID=1729650 RepID=UPI000922826B|nr:hypothetical protein [Planktothrix sp. PCC 11201]SKB13852.1 hypothetical protein PL11201_530182 [Planktothrix sp. PCC 11201]
MKTNNSLVQPGSTPISQLTINEADNAIDQELNDSELDEIAGGLFNLQTYLKFRGIDLTSTPIKLIPLN